MNSVGKKKTDSNPEKSWKERVEAHFMSVVCGAAIAAGGLTAGASHWFYSNKTEISNLSHQQELVRVRNESQDRIKSQENNIKDLEGKLASIERGIGAGNFIDVQKLFERQTLSPPAETRFFPNILAYGQAAITGWRVREIDELELARDWVIESLRATRDDLARELGPHLRRSVSWDLPDMSIAFEGHNIYQKLTPSIVVARFSKSQYIYIMIKHEQQFANSMNDTTYNAILERTKLSRSVESDFAGTAFLRWLNDLNNQNIMADTSVHIRTIQRKNGVFYADARFTYKVLPFSQGLPPVEKHIYLSQEIFMREINNELITITTRIPSWEPSQASPAFAKLTQALENFRFMDRQR